MQWAKRKSRKRRAMGEIAMGIRKELVEEGGKIETETEELMVTRVRRGEERWRDSGGICRQREDGKDVTRIRGMDRN